MHLKSRERALTAVVLVVILCGCQGKRPFVIAQVCLESVQDQSALRRELQSIAQSESAKFIDTSEDTEKGLRAIGNPNLQETLSRPIINIGIDRGSGVALTASNVGTRGNEVAIGFSEGSNPSEAHKFAKVVVGALEQHWHVEIVPNPAESGALPMKNCN